MRRPVLLLLVVGGALVVLVGVRTGLTRSAATPATQAPAEVVPLVEGQTVDFSSGQAQIKDSPADRQIVEQAVKEMRAAAEGITFPPSAPGAPPR